MQCSQPPSKGHGRARVSVQSSLPGCFSPGLEAKHNGYLAVPLPSTSQHCQAQWEPRQFQAGSNPLYFAPGKWAGQITILVGHSTRKVLGASPVLLAGKDTTPQMGCPEQQEHTSTCTEIPAPLTPPTQPSRERRELNLTSDLLIKLH